MNSLLKSSWHPKYVWGKKSDKVQWVVPKKQPSMQHPKLLKKQLKSLYKNLSHVRRARLKPVRKQLVGIWVRRIQGMVRAFRNSREIKNYSNSGLGLGLGPRGIQKRGVGRKKRKRWHLLVAEYPSSWGAILPGNVMQLIDLYFANCSGDHCPFKERSHSRHFVSRKYSLCKWGNLSFVLVEPGEPVL